MPIVLKSYSEIMKEMMKSIEVDMYGSDPGARLRKLLFKLGIKSAAPQPFFMSGIDAILKCATFDSGKLILWKDLLPQKKDEAND